MIHTLGDWLLLRNNRKVEVQNIMYMDITVLQTAWVSKSAHIASSAVIAFKLRLMFPCCAVGGNTSQATATAKAQAQSFGGSSTAIADAKATATSGRKMLAV